MIYVAVEQSPQQGFVTQNSLDRYFGKFNVKFFSYCLSELEKINTFYAGESTFNLLLDEAQEMGEHVCKPITFSSNLFLSLHISTPSSRKLRNIVKKIPINNPLNAR